MSIGERIKFVRNKRGITQKQLGLSAGFPEMNADVRMAQYELGVRSPKRDLLEKIADTLEVSPDALDVPEINNNVSLMQVLFTLEDKFGFKIDRMAGKLCINLANERETPEVAEELNTWLDQSERLNRRLITKEQYDEWRYTYSGPKTTAQAETSSKKRETEYYLL